jgi:hypothetical protein
VATLPQEGEEPPAPQEGEAEEVTPSPPPLPPPPYGGWYVENIEMLAGYRTADSTGASAAGGGGGGDGGDVVRFPMSKGSTRSLGERATARMAGMSPPPPWPPELVEGWASQIMPATSSPRPRPSFLALNSITCSFRNAYHNLILSFRAGFRRRSVLPLTRAVAAAVRMREAPQC